MMPRLLRLVTLLLVIAFVVGNNPKLLGGPPHRALERLKGGAQNLRGGKQTTPLSASSRPIIDATAPVVADNIATIVQTFYAKLMAENPSLKAFFNLSNQKEHRQSTALAHGVLAAVAHIDDLESIKSALLVMAHKHCALGVQPEQYTIVHDTFLAATAQVLGDAVTSEVAKAWSEVLMLVAGALIELEKELYEAAAKRKGGWKGLKAFTVSKIVKETEDVRSLWFKPEDGSEPPEFSAGQYITVCENPTSEALLAPRHYTISSDSELRISVKRIRKEGEPDGVMSSYLHSLQLGDAVRLRPPFGCATHATLFPQPPSADSMHLFIAGGIGITPVRALAAESVRAGQRVLVLHANGGGKHHPLAHELRDITSQKDRSVYVEGDRTVVSVEKLKEAEATHGINKEATRVFVCCPRAMTEAALDNLAAAGWNRTRIHVDFFGPKGAPATKASSKM